METITKEKIVEMLKSKLDLSGIACSEIVNQIFSNLQVISSNNKKLSIKNFGSFYTNVKAARPGMNFHTKEKIIIKPRAVMGFIPSKALKDLINKRPEAGVLKVSDNIEERINNLIYKFHQVKAML